MPREKKTSPRGPFFTQQIVCTGFTMCYSTLWDNTPHFLGDKCKSRCCGGYWRAMSCLSQRDVATHRYYLALCVGGIGRVKLRCGRSQAVTPTMSWKLGCSGRLLSHKALPGLWGAGSRLLTAGRDACSSGGMIFLLNDMQIRVSVSINQF